MKTGIDLIAEETKRYGLRSNSFHLDMYNDYVYRNV